MSAGLDAFDSSPAFAFKASTLGARDASKTQVFLSPYVPPVFGPGSNPEWRYRYIEVDQPTYGTSIIKQVSDAGAATQCGQSKSNSNQWVRWRPAIRKGGTLFGTGDTLVPPTTPSVITYKFFPIAKAGSPGSILIFAVDTLGSNSDITRYDPANFGPMLAAVPSSSLVMNAINSVSLNVAAYLAAFTSVNVGIILIQENDYLSIAPTALNQVDTVNFTRPSTPSLGFTYEEIIFS